MFVGNISILESVEIDRKKDSKNKQTKPENLERLSWIYQQ